MAWSRLDCWIIHKLLWKCRPIYTFFSCKYGTFVTAKNGSYLALILPIMKYETYWYRYPTVAPHGDGFSPGKTKNSRSVCLGPLATALKLWSSVTIDSSKCRLMHWNTKCASILLVICNCLLRWPYLLCFGHNNIYNRYRVFIQSNYVQEQASWIYGM